MKRILKLIRYYLPIFLCGIMLQVQLGYMNGLDFQLKVSVGMSEAFADACIDAGTCCSEHGEDSSLCISQCQQNPGSSGCPEPGTGSEDDGCSEEEEGDSGLCLLNDIEYEEDATKKINWGQYMTQIAVWTAMLLLVVVWIGCSKNPAVTCGWSVLAQAIAAVALLIGEITYVAMFKKGVDDLQYRPDQLQKYARDCETDAEAVGQTGGIDTGEEDDTTTTETDESKLGICDQFQAIKDQKESLEKGLEGARWKFRLQIAAASALGIAAIMELVAHFKVKAKLKTAMITRKACKKMVDQPVLCAAECNNPSSATCADCTTESAKCSLSFLSSEAVWTELYEALNNLTPEHNASRCRRARRVIDSIQTNYASNCAGVRAGPVLQQCGIIGLVTAFQSDLKCTRNLSCDLHGCNLIEPRPCPPEPTTYWACSLTYNNPNWEQFNDPSFFHYENPKKIAVNYMNDVFDFERYDTSLIEDDMSQVFWEKVAFDRGMDQYNRSLDLTTYKTLAPIYHRESDSEEQFSELMSLLIPTAHAKKGTSARMNAHKWGSFAMGLAVGVVGVIILGITLGRKKIIHMGSTSTPIKRFGWILGAAALVGGAAAMTKTLIMNQLEKHIAMLQGIIDNATGTEDDFADDGGTSSAGGSSSDHAWEEDWSKYLPENGGGGGAPCLGEPDGKGGCKEVGPMLDSQLKALGLSSLAGTGGSAGGVVDEGLSADPNGADMNNATNNALAARKKVKKKLMKLRKKLSKNENKAASKMAQSALAQIRRAANKAIAKSGMSPKAIADALGNNGLGDKSGGNEEEIKKAIAAGAAAPGGKGADPFSFDFGGDDGGGGGGDHFSDEEPEMDDDMMVKDGDIFKDPGGDIFKMLTVRYMKTAYPVFFDAEDAIEPMDTTMGGEVVEEEGKEDEEAK